VAHGGAALDSAIKGAAMNGGSPIYLIVEMAAMKRN
jgi:hypothetical protein